MNTKNSNDNNDMNLQLKHLSDNIELNNELIKMMLVSTMMSSGASLFLGTNEHIVYDNVDMEIFHDLKDRFDMEKYLIDDIPCIMITPKIKMKMQELYEAYLLVEQHDICCIIASENFSSYEIRRCRELGLNRIDKKRRSITINY